MGVPMKVTFDSKEDFVRLVWRTEKGEEVVRRFYLALPYGSSDSSVSPWTGVWKVKYTEKDEYCVVRSRRDGKKGLEAVRLTGNSHVSAGITTWIIDDIPVVGQTYAGQSWYA